MQSFSCFCSLCTCARGNPCQPTPCTPKCGLCCSGSQILPPARYHSPCAPGTHPVAVVFVNRRILGSGGKRQNEAVAAVVGDAKRYRGLLQLDPLDDRDRYNYLCMSLKTAQVPLEVSGWVSDMANGNPQCTEICAKAIEKAGISSMVKKPGGPGIFGIKPAAALNESEPPSKIAGFIRSSLASLNPEEKLVTQLVSMWPSGDERLPVLLSKEILRLSFETVALIDEGCMDEILRRLLLSGIIVEREDEGNGGSTSCYLSVRKC